MLDYYILYHIIITKNIKFLFFCLTFELTGLVLRLMKSFSILLNLFGIYGCLFLILGQFIYQNNPDLFFQTNHTNNPKYIIQTTNFIKLEAKKPINDPVAAFSAR